MKSRLATHTAFALVCALSLSACGGGGAKSNIQTSNSTIGQELMDLDESYKKGLISEKEYNAAKKQILQRYK
jgi:hypothetical protein